MAKEITMPKLSDTMTDGQFICWRRKIGERIERGDIIAEVETDKAVMELEAFASGFLIKTMAKAGETVPVGTVLGLIGEAGELPQPDAAAAPVQAPVQVPDPATAPATAAPQAAEPAEVAATVKSETAEPAQETAAAQPSTLHEAVEHEKASPNVRRMAREQGIDLSQVHGSGPEGRITQADMEQIAPRQQGLPPSPAQPLIPPETTQEPVPAVPALSASVASAATEEQPSAMRQAIAASVTRSWREIPHFSVTMEIGMDACREIVNELKEAEPHVGYNAIIIKSCAVALKDFPLLHTAPGTPDDSIPISFAVSLADGMMMPVIRNCQRLSLAEIEHEAALLIYKSRDGKLTSEEMSGGTFSLTNLGMYGVDEFTALIMPGQTAILAVGAVSQRPVVREGQIIAAYTMRVTLSCNHRVIDGAYAAAFLAELRSILQRPVSLLI